MVRYLFRQPRFPVICDIEGVLIGAESPDEFVEQLSGLKLQLNKQLPVIDATGEGWGFYTDVMVISPFVIKKRWTKKEIINMFNGSDTARSLGRQYSTKSLSSKRLDLIVRQIVEIIRSADQPLQTT